MERRLITDRETDRHLAVILLDLATVVNQRADMQEAWPDDREAQDKVSNQLAALDDQVDELRIEARLAIFRDTQVEWQRIEEASL